MACNQHSGYNYIFRIFAIMVTIQVFLHYNYGMVEFIFNESWRLEAFCDKIGKYRSSRHRAFLKLPQTGLSFISAGPTGLVFTFDSERAAQTWEYDSVIGIRDRKSVLIKQVWDEHELDRRLGIRVVHPRHGGRRKGAGGNVDRFANVGAAERSFARRW